MPGCVYLNETVMSATKVPPLAGGLKICSAPPQFEHDPPQVCGCLIVYIRIIVYISVIQYY